MVVRERERERERERGRERERRGEGRGEGGGRGRGRGGEGGGRPYCPCTLKHITSPSSHTHLTHFILHIRNAHRL